MVEHSDFFRLRNTIENNPVLVRRQYMQIPGSVTPCDRNIADFLLIPYRFGADQRFTARIQPVCNTGQAIIISGTHASVARRPDIQEKIPAMMLGSDDSVLHARLGCRLYPFVRIVILRNAKYLHPEKKLWNRQQKRQKDIGV